MNILGISCYYHDSAAALVQDGKLIAAAEEERGFLLHLRDPNCPWGQTFLRSSKNVHKYINNFLPIYARGTLGPDPILILLCQLGVGAGLDSEQSPGVIGYLLLV